MTTTLILAATASAITLMLCVTASRAWRGWLELRREELAHPVGDKDEIGVRIELASVKERLKKLEAIASGVDI